MDSIRLPLSRGLYAVIDAADFDLVGRHKWCALPSRNTWYATRAAPAGTAPRIIAMHRVLLCAAPGVRVDHRNGDGLDNRRGNLRLCTNQQNCRNQGLARNNRSGFKGVSWYPNYGKWLATIWDGRRKVFLGYYADPAEAARAYDATARELFGAFARPNFPA